MLEKNNSGPGAHQVAVELTFVPYEQCDINQRLAWDRLWMWLLRYEPDKHALDQHVSPIATCAECCRNWARCVCANRKGLT